jgi:hypothetical protein
MTIRDYGKQLFDYIENGLKSVDEKITQGSKWIPVKSLQHPFARGVYFGGTTFLAGFVVKVFSPGVRPLNCAIVSGLFALVTGYTMATLKPILVEEEAFLAGLVVGSIGSYVGARLIGIPFAPWTCTAVAVTLVSFAFIRSMGQNL